MKNQNLQLTLTLLFTALFLIAFLAVSGIGGFILGIGAARNLAIVARIAGGLALLGFLAAALVIAIQAALQPASRWRKFLLVLPLFCLSLLVVGILLELAGIGTTGPFALGWLAVSGLLSLIAILVTAARLNLNSQTLKQVALAMGITGGLSLLAYVGMIIAVVLGIISPTALRPGGFSQGQGQQPGGGEFPAGGGGQPGNFGGGGPGGGGQPGNFGSGGPGEFGGRGASSLPLIIGAVVLTIFIILAIIFIVQLWRNRTTLNTGAIPTLNYRAEAGQAVLSFAVIGLVVLLVSQVIPVNRTNPAVQTTVQWDSPETQQLFENACADCHSNETKWPWYGYIAPGSWLLASHVSGGRERWNISELNALEAFERQRLPEEIAQNVSSGAMPPADYLLMHPAAQLTDAQKEQLVQGLQNAVAQTTAP